MKSNLRAIVSASLIFAVVAVPYSFYNEQSPINHIKVVAGPIATSRVVPVKVKLFRSKLCSYIIERRVFDADDNKVFDAVELLSEPDTLGAVEFGAPITVSTHPVNGKALYQVRLSSMCNFVQRMFPRAGEWINSIFEFAIPK